jgi:hypothetical protein
MRLITQHELAQRSDKDLSSLFLEATQALITSAPESAERRNALATMENISRERRARCQMQP